VREKDEGKEKETTKLIITESPFQAVNQLHNPAMVLDLYFSFFEPIIPQFR